MEICKDKQWTLYHPYCEGIIRVKVNVPNVLFFNILSITSIPDEIFPNWSFPPICRIQNNIFIIFVGISISTWLIKIALLQNFYLNIFLLQIGIIHITFFPAIRCKNLSQIQVISDQVCQ